MTIVQVKDATGSVLDWMVAKACYPDEEINLSFGFPYLRFGRFNPTSDWRHCGPIIEREKIDCVADPNGKDVWMGRLYATQQAGVKVIRAYGPTPLIAAMRCYVSSVLGDQVEVPDELL
jgi:hypothetical protein